MNGRKVLLLVAAIITVSWSAPLIRLANEAPAVVVAFWRTAIATVVLAPFALLRNREEIKSFSRRDVIALLASAAFLAVHFATWIASVNMTSVASSALLVASNPIFVAVISAFIGERIGRKGWIGIGLAIIGGAIVTGGDLFGANSSARGDLLAIVGAVAVAGYLIVGRRLRVRMTLFPYVVMVYGTCSLILLAAASFSRVSLVDYSFATWLPILAIAAGPQLFGHTTLNYLLADLEATKVAVAVMGEPIGSAAIAAVLFREIPGWLVLPGGIVLLAGIWLAMTSRSLPVIETQ